MILITRDEALRLQRLGFDVTKTKTKHYATEDSRVLLALKNFNDSKEKNK